MLIPLSIGKPMLILEPEINMPANSEVEENIEVCERATTWASVFIFLILYGTAIFICIHFGLLASISRSYDGPGAGTILLILIPGGASLFFIAVGIGTLWKNSLRYTLKGNLIEVESGIIFKTITSISFDRITDISRKQGPLQKLCSIYSINLETAGQSNRMRPEGRLDGIDSSNIEILEKLKKRYLNCKASR